MKVGIPLFMLRAEQLVPVARRAEELGFESVWVAEHLVFPTQFTSRYPYTADGVPPINPATPLLDPLLVLAQIAAVTTQIRLGTNIYVLPLRHPLVTARLGVTLDVLSGGRFSFGVGVGWLEEEFAAAGVDFARRGALLRECVRALRSAVDRVGARVPRPRVLVRAGQVRAQAGAEAASADPRRWRERRGAEAGGGRRRRLVRRQAHAGDRRCR